MNLVFLNPLGLLALLGIPALLLIHLLQRQSRQVVISTLFLLERLSPLSLQGRRIERLRNSLPLWLQILMVLLVTWLLAKPTWLKTDSQQTLVVVLDSSLSMQAFRTDLLQTLHSRLPELQKQAAQTRWILIESDPTQKTLYQGDSLQTLLSRLDTWKPALGTHDATLSLTQARSLLHGTGRVIWVSDRASELPAGIHALLVGHPIPNVGFSGARVEGDQWTALLSNPSDISQTRTWHLETASEKTPAQTVTLAPGQTLRLKGVFPAEERAVLVLDADAFTPDDRLPLLKPHAKPLHTSNLAAPKDRDFFDRFAASIPESISDTDSPDLTFAHHDPIRPTPLPANAIVSVSSSAGAWNYLTGPLVVEPHALTENLHFQGLIVRDGPQIRLTDSDQVLLWQGGKALIFLRRSETGDADRLVINFDLAASNADRTPSFIVLLHRYAEALRARKVGEESQNVDTHQRLEVATLHDGPPLTGVAQTRPLRAPNEPGFFELWQGDQKRFTGAAQFADSREADFRSASTSDSTPQEDVRIAEVNRRELFFTPAAVLLLTALTFTNWAAQARRPTA